MCILKCYSFKVRFLSFLVTPLPGIQDIGGIFISLCHYGMHLTTSGNIIFKSTVSDMNIATHHC